MKALWISIAFLTLLVGVAGCSKPSMTSSTSPTPTVTVITTPAPTVSVPSVADAVAKAKPAVVRVITESGMGSGMIVDKAGYVLTNSHVIEGYQTAIVMLSSGQKLPATILGRDEITDLAILKVSGENLPVVTFGDSSKLRQGEEVVAIGYPLDLAGSTTITKGIVSAFRNYEGVIYVQTDTAINPGNSGGALINLKGEVVGVNVMSIRVAGGQTIEGMNFAIAINGAKPIIPKLIAGESILKPETWETYTNDAYGYSIQYPSTWKLSTSNSPTPGRVVINSSGTASISISRSERGSLTIFEILDWEIKGNSSVLSVYQVQSRNNLMWQGVYQACEWTLLHQPTVTWPMLKSKNLYLDYNGYIYRVKGLANESEYETYSSTIDTIIDSFRLTE
jgi:S1-C subfamily serine protease